MKNNNDRLLNWLQNFLAGIADFDLFPEIPDSAIDSYTSFNDIGLLPKMLKINNVSNPGWSLYFNIKDSPLLKYKIKKNKYFSESNEVGQSLYGWYSVLKDNDTFDSGSTFLSVCLETLKLFSENKKILIKDLDEFRAPLEADNKLLFWLEEFYLSCCDEDWEFSFGYNIITVKGGWLVTLSVEELYYEDTPFEKVTIEEEGGVVECYKLDSQFIIRAHPCGLITGIKVFKDWIESQPEYADDKRKDYYEIHPITSKTID